VRDRRAHLVTIYGEAGVGKSRLARDFASSLQGATVFVGRSLPYGEGITYWPLTSAALVLMFAFFVLSTSPAPTSSSSASGSRPGSSSTRR
jgi:hypothetical protein